MIPLNHFRDKPEGGKLQPVPIFYREDPYSLPRVFGVRFYEGGADRLLLIIIFIGINKVAYQALLY